MFGPIILGLINFKILLPICKIFHLPWDGLPRSLVPCCAPSAGAGPSLLYSPHPAARTQEWLSAVSASFSLLTVSCPCPPAQPSLDDADRPCSRASSLGDEVTAFKTPTATPTPLPRKEKNNLGQPAHVQPSCTEDGKTLSTAASSAPQTISAVSFPKPPATFMAADGFRVGADGREDWIFNSSFKKTLILADSQGVGLAPRMADENTSCVSLRGAMISSVRIPSPACFPSVKRIVLFIGGNTVRYLFHHRLSPSQYTTQLSSLISLLSLHFPNARFLVTSMFQRKDFDRDFLDKINDEILKFAFNNKDIDFIQLPPISNADRSYRDGIHLSRSGISKIERVLKGSLKKNDEVTSATSSSASALQDNSNPPRPSIQQRPDSGRRKFQPPRKQSPAQRRHHQRASTGHGAFSSMPPWLADSKPVPLMSIPPPNFMQHHSQFPSSHDFNRPPPTPSQLGSHPPAVQGNGLLSPPWGLPNSPPAAVYPANLEKIIVLGVTQILQQLGILRL